MIVSTMVARYLIVPSAALLQIALARGFYGMPFPQHPGQLAVAFGLVASRFWGWGW